MADYAHPEVLVTTDWLRQNLKTPNVRIVEVDVDPKLYAAGHIPGAVGWDWTTQLQDQLRRDIISREDFEKLNSEAGIKNSDTIIIYGDSSNWFAAYGFWLYKIYGHKDVRLLNGGRAKWRNEEGKTQYDEEKTLPITKAVKVVKASYDKEARKMVNGDPLEGGLKHDAFTSLGKKKDVAGVLATLITDAGNKNISVIRVLILQFKKNYQFNKK